MTDDGTGSGPERLYSGAAPDEVFAELAPLVEFQESGMPMDELEAMVRERLLPHLMRYDLPTFHALFNAPLEEGAAFGAHLALDWNQGVTNWQVSPGGAVLEELCCRALCRLFGLAPAADATVLYSGTYANQQGLYMALHRRAEQEGFDFSREGIQGFDDPSRLAVVTSAEAHFSLKHAVRVLGLGERALVTVGVDERRRMDMAELRTTLADLEGGRDVFCVVPTAGTTSAGAVDPIREAADLVEAVAPGEGRPWLHVDGAYGLAYALVPEWAPLFEGLDRADSIAWDPHKQMAVPIPNSVLFVKDGDEFRRMALFSHYWNRPESEGPNPGVKSMPSTRPLASLPLVTSIRHQGMRGVVARLRHHLDAIRELAVRLRDEPDIELMHEPDTGILCFRIHYPALPGDRHDELQEALYRTILDRGERMISITEMDGRKALRLVAVSSAVTTESMLEAVAEGRRIAGGMVGDLAGEGTPSSPRSGEDPSAGEGP